MEYDYEIHTSQDGNKWRFMAGWNNGNPSRWAGKEFCVLVAIKEYKSFNNHRGSSFKHTRLTINTNDI